MTAKEYLKQYEYATKRAEKFHEEYKREMLLVDAIRSTTDNDGMPHGSGISKPTEEKALRLADRALRWKQAELDAIETRQQVFETICNIPGIEGDVLFERYIRLHKWEEICALLHYSWQGIHLIHRRALAIVESRLKCTNN